MDILPDEGYDTVKLTVKQLNTLVYCILFTRDHDGQLNDPEDTMGADIEDLLDTVCAQAQETLEDK